ncbi:hypothetical protein ABZS77_23740 [Micromonospora sp. NPDC005298]
MLQPEADTVRPAALRTGHPLVSGAYETVLRPVVRGAGGSTRRRRGRVVG